MGEGESQWRVCLTHELSSSLSHDPWDRRQDWGTAQTHTGIKTGHFEGRTKFIRKWSVVEGFWICLLTNVPLQWEWRRLLNWVIEADHNILSPCPLKVRMISINPSLGVLFPEEPEPKSCTDNSKRSLPCLNALSSWRNIEKCMLKRKRKEKKKNHQQDKDLS